MKYIDIHGKNLQYYAIQCKFPIFRIRRRLRAIPHFLDGDCAPWSVDELCRNHPSVRALNEDFFIQTGAALVFGQAHPVTLADLDWLVWCMIQFQFWLPS